MTEKKRHKVESKYKNPDKMIDSQKKRIGELQRAWDSALKYQKTLEGDFVEDYEKVEPDTLRTDTVSLFEFEVGDTIINIGEVVDVVASKKDNESTIFYHTLETRRRPKN